MLERFRKRKRSVYDEPIALLLTRINEVKDKPSEFESAVRQLVKLEELKEKEAKRRISPDTLLIVGGNLLGILIIVGYEQKHVMVSRALNFVSRSEPKIQNRP